MRFMSNKTSTLIGCKNSYQSNTCLGCMFTPSSIECNNHTNIWDLEKVYSSNDVYLKREAELKGVDEE